MLRLLSLALAVMFTWSAATAQEYQRVVLIEDARLDVTLLLQKRATPADENWVGFEFNNKTDAPLLLENASYRLGRVILSDLTTREGLVDTSMASGNSYDLLWRDGERPPEKFPRDYLAPGITKRTVYSSAYSMAILGWPKGEGLSAAGAAHFSSRLPGKVQLQTPPEGVAFRFEWCPPDGQGIKSMRKRLLRTLAKPVDQFGDAHLLRFLLARPEIASVADVPTLLAGLKTQQFVARPAILKHLEAHHARDPRVNEFVLDCMRDHEQELLRQIAGVEGLADASWLPPLVELIVENRRDHTADYALRIFPRVLPLVPEEPRRQAIATAGAAVLQRSALVKADALPEEAWRWQSEVESLALTRDPAAVPVVAKWLGDKTVVVDAKQVAIMNNGVSLRACDIAYNTILTLSSRDGERFTLGFSTHDWDDTADALVTTKRLNPDEEFARRDKLIAALKADLGR
jgi:hypothetical protein